MEKLRPPPVPVPLEVWTQLYRGILRECSYLPDPVAQRVMKSRFQSRFRKYWKCSVDVPKQNTLKKNALKQQSFLRRANEGYSRPLEKVLRMVYGRIGKRRWELVQTLLEPEPPTNTAGLRALIEQPEAFADGWKAPAILVELLKSQQHNSIVAQLGVRSPVRALEPPIPKEDSWGKELAARRRKNLRQKWYSSIRERILPPLPESDLHTLEGLITGTIPWKLPKKRVPVGQEPLERRKLTANFLAEGPEKELTFREYSAGRPHKITNRFMRRLWKRISCLVPRMEWDATAQKHMFHWDTIKPAQKISTYVNDDKAIDDIFADVDDLGRVIGKDSTETKPSRAAE